MLRWAAVIFVVFLGPVLPTYGQSESQADLIERARTQKEANLTPEAAPKGEVRIESIENSVPYRLLTGQVDGFGVGFGNIVPGAGFAAGPQYSRNDLLGGRLAVKVQARAASNQSYLGRVDALLPSILKDRVFLAFSAVHRNISEMPYYGPGPSSRKSGRSDYRLEDTTLELSPGVRIYKGLRAAMIGSYLAVNVGPGNANQFASTDRQFSPSAAPGIDRQTNFWRGGGLVEYDWRDQASGATSGGRYAAQYVRYLDTQLGRFTFMRVDLDATQFIPMLNRTRVIVLRGASSLTTTNPTQQVPFYLQPTLGGPDTLRGYRFERFYGPNSTLVTTEYRWDASPILQMVAFADGGKVFNSWEQWNFHRLQTDVGFGFRFRNLMRRTVLSFDTAFSHEGFQIWFRVNNSL